MKISIPFREDMSLAIICREKTATTRTKRYGSIGDEFIVDYQGYKLECVITDIKRLKLSEVAYCYHRQEGFDSVEGFVETWCEIHPVRGFDHNQLVWLHSFEPSWNISLAGEVVRPEKKFGGH
jgi:hypothetical protein